MEVLPAQERLDEALVARQVRKQAQLDLRVVARQDDVVGTRRHKGRPHHAAQVAAHGDVLQVGVRRREPAGSRDRLVVGGVHPAVAENLARQRVEVGRLDLHALAIVEDVGHHGVVACKALEKLGVRGVEAGLGLLEGATRLGVARRQAEGVKEHAGELGGRVDVELLARKVEDARANLLDLARKQAGLMGEDFRVHLHAVALEHREHRDKRHLDVSHAGLGAVLLKKLVEHLAQRQKRSGRARTARRARLLGGGGSRRSPALLRCGRELQGRKAPGQERPHKHTGLEVRAVRIEQVGSHPGVEHLRAAGRGELRGIKACGLGGIERVQAAQVGLGVERDDLAALICHEQGVESVVAVEAQKARGLLRRRALAHQPSRRAGKPQGLRTAEKRTGVLTLVEEGAHPGVASASLLQAFPGSLSLQGLGRQVRSLRLRTGACHVVAALLGLRPARAAQHAALEGAQRQRVKGALHLGRVKGGPHGRLGVKRDRRVAADAGHLARHQGVVCVVADVLAHLALDVVGVGKHGVKRAVLHDERSRLLGANAGHAGDVVARVALEAVEVGDLLGLHALVERADLLRAHDGDVAHALPVGEDRDVAVGKLVGVAVARDEQHLVALLLALPGKRAEQVVALPALNGVHRHVHRREQLAHHGELLGEQRVARGALRLVLGEHLHAHRGAALVEGDHDAVGVEVFHQAQEHAHETKDGVGGSAVGGVHGCLHRMKCAMHEGVAVNDSKRQRPCGRHVVFLFHETPSIACESGVAGHTAGLIVSIGDIIRSRTLPTTVK